MTILDTAKPDGLGPQACLADIFGRSHNNKISRLNEPPPWNRAPRVFASDSRAA